MIPSVDASILVWVALGGAVGAAARYALSGGIQRRAGGRFPWGTMAVNLSGCLLAGFVTGLLADPGLPADAPAAGVTAALGLAGFLGAFTTFSGFVADAVRLGGSSARVQAALYLLGSLILGVMAAGVGLLASRLPG